MSDDEEMDEDDGFFVPHGYLSSDEENQLTEGKIFLFNVFVSFPQYPDHYNDHTSQI